MALIQVINKIDFGIRFWNFDFEKVVMKIDGKILQ